MFRSPHFEGKSSLCVIKPLFTIPFYYSILLYFLCFALSHSISLSHSLSCSIALLLSLTFVRSFVHSAQTGFSKNMHTHVHCTLYTQNKSIRWVWHPKYPTTTKKMINNTWIAFAVVNDKIYAIGCSTHCIDSKWAYNTIFVRKYMAQYRARRKEREKIRYR